jgi:hypothetical protein
VPEEYAKEFLMWGGTVAGFVAALLSIFEKLLKFKDEWRSRRTSRKNAATEPDQQEATGRFEPVSTTLFQKASYLFLYETSVILAAGVLLNYIGLTLSRHLHSILFLDMTGTALVAFLLGPWWGAIVALLSNSMVNWLLFPETGGDVVIFPWSLVNMTGALVWGYLARAHSFTTYLRRGKKSGASHAWFLFTFGVCGAVAMSIPGTLVQAALGETSVFALNPEVAETLSQRVSHWEAFVKAQVETLYGLTWVDSLSWVVVNWFQNCVRYIPDKTMSAAIALVVLKYGYPLFERELIHGGPNGDRPGDERMLPLVLGFLYAPSYATLLTSEQYAGAVYWPLWTTPWVAIVCGYVWLRYWGAPDSELHKARLQRGVRYAQALKPIKKEPNYEFCRRLTFATLIASLIFALALPVLLTDFYRVAFNFFCVVYGFLLVVHLVRVAIAQNLSVARADE